MNRDSLEKLFYFTENHFEKWYGLLSAEILLAFIFFGFYKIIPTEIQSLYRFLTFYLLVLTVVALIIFIAWWRYVYVLPKLKKNRIGTIFAINTENSRDYGYLKNDFVKRIKEKMSDNNLPFDVKMLRSHQAARIENRTDAQMLMKKTKAKFVVWGSLSQRGGDSSKKYFFKLRAMVAHAQIEDAQKKMLVGEFNKLLPETVMFEEKMQYEALQFRSDQLFATIDYIVGRAALLSGDPTTALILHESLFINMQQGLQCEIPENLLQKILSLECDIKAWQYHLSDDMKNFKLFTEKSLGYFPENYGALLKKAIIEFNNGYGDPVQALKTIKKAKKVAHKNNAWLFSRIFLQLWLEQYPDALRSCDKLINNNYNGDELTAREILQFNENILKQNRKPQLLFWCGFVAYNKAKKIALADGYFQEFIDETKDNNSMNELQNIAKKYLKEIKKEINY